ncbi:Retrotransposon gag protein [Corchorus olitorius]|uniref:Retrotransposon gag protein n=1 Tax=Corchorus olitorius TaxID=93759 RepID=A0A1R3I7F6_9ROSI|nr:Retrotransposon gag protein [Corchorus olitorius]
MPPRRAPGRGRGRGRSPLQRLPHRLPKDAEEESSVHSSPTNENLNVDPPPPPQWQHVPPPPCSPYKAFMDWRQRFETQIPQYEAAQPPVGQGQYVPPPPPIYGDWLDSVIDAFDDMELEDSDRVKIASRLLDEDAKAWWVSVKDRVGGPVTWENFLSEFNKEYYSKFEKGRISGEFLALKQGDMSVSDYDNKLRRLFRHMPGANEDLLCARFANGLALELQSSISSLITDTTRTVPYSHLGTQTQASRGGRNFNTGRYTTAALIASGREASGSGFNTRDRVQTRLYTMTREAAQDNPNSITGTVILFRNYARALIDTGAEHSYVSYGFAQYADIPLSPLFPELIVQTPFGESLLKTEVYRECALLVGHMVFEADLIPLEIYDFDVILGMDRLNKHGAQIDCETKTMMLKKPDFPPT